MMSFCKKSVHSFLGLTIPMSNTTNLDDLDHHNHKPKLSLPVLTNSPSSGLGLITVTDIDTYKTPPNVLESATFKSSSPSPQPPPLPEVVEFVPFFKKDPGGFGFIDDIGGGVNGLMSCTESLGFESCDERRVDDEMDELCSRTRSSSSSSRVSHWRKSYSERKEVKKFPPPLSSLNHNGQPSFFLKPVRKDGRLELTEVRIDRPEILRASRENGRLRLHLIRDNEEEDDQEEEEEGGDNDDNIQENEEMLVENREEEVKEILIENKEEEEVKENELLKEEIAGEWRFPVNGEGFRRCHELVSHHHGHHDYHHHHHHNHHHNLHVWSQHCVPTR